MASSLVGNPLFANQLWLEGSQPEHRSGKDHVVPDTLSRALIPEPSTVEDNLIIPPVPWTHFL